MKPGDNSRERILAMGGPGAGKTTAWVKWAQWYRKRNEEGKFFVIDTDATTERSLSGDSSWVENVEVVEPWGWDEYLATVRDFRKKAVRERNDVLVIDSVDKVWDEAQSGFTDKCFGKGIDEWFVEFRRDSEKGGSPFAGEYGVNWQVINKMYAAFMMEVARFPGHVYCTTPAVPVKIDTKGSGKGDSKEIVNLYGRLGFRPQGQKNLSHQFHTVLLMSDAGKGDWRMQTAKDREREMMGGVEVGDWVVNYLVKVGGWKL